MIRGVIFDLDGTVADNMRWHALAWAELGRRTTGHAVSEEWIYARAGMKNEDLIPDLLGRATDAAEVQRLSVLKEELYRELYRPHLAPLPGLHDLLESLTRARIGLAVASAAPKANRDFLLDGLQIRGRFAAEIGPEHAARGKPAPDMFLAAAKALSLSPGACLVVEDAVNGVKAAKAAGSPCLAVTTTAREDDLRAAGARWVQADLTRLDDDLRALLSG